MSGRNRGLRGVLEGLDIIQSDGSHNEPEATEPSAPPNTSSAPAPATPAAATSASVDAGMVTKIKTAVTAATHAPRLASFLSNLETAKKAFPNDERSAVNAALVFSQLTSSDIRDELTKAVAAAMLEAESRIKRDIGEQRDLLATTLGAETEQHRSSIASLEEQIKTLQGQLGTSQTALSKIDSTRTQKTAAINSSEATALASLAAVRAELTTLSNLLPA